MNDNIQTALQELRNSLERIDDWAKLIRENQLVASKVIKDAAKALEQLETLVATVGREINDFLGVYREKADKTIEDIEETLLQLNQAVMVTAELVDYLRSVNFPARLDKIDASVAAITQGVQNLSDKLDRYKDSLENKIEKEQEQTRQLIAAQAQETQNRLGRLEASIREEVQANRNAVHLLEQQVQELSAEMKEQLEQEGLKTRKAVDLLEQQVQGLEAEMKEQLEQEGLKTRFTIQKLQKRQNIYFAVLLVLLLGSLGLQVFLILK